MALGQRLPVARGGHVTGRSGHESTCRAEIDRVIGSAGARAGGGVIEVNLSGAWRVGLAPGNGHARASRERYINRCAVAAGEDR